MQFSVVFNVVRVISCTSAIAVRRRDTGQHGGGGGNIAVTRRCVL